jgi:hypothetical protein
VTTSSGPAALNAFMVFHVLIRSVSYRNIGDIARREAEERFVDACVGGVVVGVQCRYSRYVPPPRIRRIPQRHIRITARVHRVGVCRALLGLGRTLSKRCVPLGSPSRVPSRGYGLSDAGRQVSLAGAGDIVVQHGNSNDFDGRRAVRTRPGRGGRGPVGMDRQGVPAPAAG